MNLADLRKTTRRTVHFVLSTLKFTRSPVCMVITPNLCRRIHKTVPCESNLGGKQVYYHSRESFYLTKIGAAGVSGEQRIGVQV